MDGCTCCVRGWQLSRALDRELTLAARTRALVDHVSDMHHSDQGWQYACDDYTNLLTAYNVQISMAAGGKPEANGDAEQLIRTLKQEEVTYPNTSISMKLIALSGTCWMKSIPASAFTRRWAISLLSNLSRIGCRTSPNPY